MKKLSQLSRFFAFTIAAFSCTCTLASPLFDNTNANFWRVNPSTGQIDSFSVLDNYWLEGFFNNQGQPIYVLTDPNVGLVNQLANSSVPLQHQSNGTYLPAISIAGLGVADYGNIEAPIVNTFNIYPESGTYNRTIKVTIDIDGELFVGDKTLELTWGVGSSTSREIFTTADVNSYCLLYTSPSPRDV